MANVLVTGSFDDLRSLDIRFLEEASKRGPLTVSLWDDAAVKAATGRDAKFPLAERKYFVESIRYVSKVTVAPTADVRAALAVHPDVLIERERDASAESRSACGARDAKYEVVSEAVLEQFPKPAACPDGCNCNLCPPCPTLNCFDSCTSDSTTGGAILTCEQL